MDDRFKLLYDEFDREAQLEKDALALRQRTVQDALDVEERARRDALDRQQRAESEALDRDLQVLDRAFNLRKAVLKRQQQDEEDALLAQIDQLFGADRQAAIDKLFNMRNQHDDQLQQLDDQHSNEKQVLKDSLTDQQTLENNAYDDAKKARQEALNDQQKIEKDALDAILLIRKTAIDDRKTIAERAYEDEKNSLQRNLDDKKTLLQRGLDDQLRIRRNQHENERTLAAEQRPLTLAEYQKTLDDQKKQYETHNTNMAIVAGRGGLDMASAVMAEIGKLPPEIVAAVANAGPAAFTAFIDSMKLRAGAVDATTVGEPIIGLLKRIGEMAGPAFAQSMALKIANDPQAQQTLQNVLLSLIAPKPVPGQPGVYQVPKPGGGFFPVKMAFANGGVVRFADGGEYHVAQVAPAGAMRVWAEPETGGEAYIPLAASKRARSLSVLQTVATQFGMGLTRMADGGVVRAPGSLSMGSAGGRIDNSVTVTADVRVTVAAGVDPNAVGAAVDEAMTRRLDSLARQIVAVGRNR